MPRNIPTRVTNSQRIRPKPQAMDSATASLRRCGCLEDWRVYTKLAVTGKSFEMFVRRLRLCIQEQCWSNSDIESITLTSSDSSQTFPDIVRKCLATKLKNAKNLKKEALSAVCEHRKLLEEKHKLCNSRYGAKHLNTAFKDTNAQVKEYGMVR